MEDLPGLYKLDIQQGNRVSQDMINQLRPNMNKRQVLYIMGSPMLIDVFHKKRWDYLYSNQPGGEDREQSRISLFFEGDILVGVQGDFRPDNQAKRVSKDMTVDVPARHLDQSLWGKAVRLLSDDDNTAEDTDEADEENSEEQEAEKEKTSENTDKASTAALVEEEPIVEEQTEKEEKTVDETSNTDEQTADETTTNESTEN